jgi:hypothetical protein
VRQDGLRHCAGKVESSLFRTPVAFHGKNLCNIFSGADPDFFHPGFRIQQQRGGEKIIVFLDMNFTIENCFIF